MVRVVDLIKNKGDGGVLPPKGLSSYSNNYASDADRVSFVAAKSSEKISNGAHERSSVF